jgi:glycine oxidase
METPDVLILGAGVIGCSLARELVRARLQVTVLERGLVGCGASSAAAGLLSPTFQTATTDPLVRLCRHSAELYESWVEELRAEGAGDVGFQRPGLLDVWTDATEFARQRAALEEASAHRVELLTGDELRQREPGLAPNVVGGAFYPDDAQVDPGRLTRAVASVAERNGAQIRENEPVQRIAREGDRLTAVHTSSACYWPGLVVVTAGAWSGGLAEILELDLPTQPVKGQMLQAACRIAPVRLPVHAGNALLVPRRDGTLLLGVTIEEAGFDDRVTLDAIRTILGETTALVPAVKPLQFVRAWAGLRPGTPDGWPYMGPLPPLRNLWVSTGHFRKGILLAPLCARLVAQSILADELADELTPFRPNRRLAC